MAGQDGARRSQLPGNNPTKLIEELKRQLDLPWVHDMLRLHSEDAMDVIFRVSRRQAVAGPKIVLHKMPPSTR